MKTTTLALALTAAGSVAASGGHHHNHLHRRRHQHLAHDKRETEVVAAPGPTVYAFELDGGEISQDKACDGIDAGHLLWADGLSHPEACEPPPPPPSTSSAAGEFFEAEVETTSAPAYTPPPPEPTTPAYSPPPAASPTPPSYGGGGGGGGEGEGLETEFPDGELSCSEFPSDYGAVNLDYLGLGGWSGIQFVNKVGDAFGSIRTATKNDECSDGAMCSYACPPGYQKSQWPEAQGAKGESVGGLECSGGKLYLTNPSLSKTLCIQGTEGIEVQNDMSEQASVCRTDYPGTEEETVPLDAQPGTTRPLTCPKSADYYKWQGGKTTAQYYVNPKGVPVEEACLWGDESNPTGNWAPVNLGVGTDENGVTWLSIFQNKPTTDEQLDFKVRIEGDDLSGECYYENGAYYGEGQEDGCTVSTQSGKATFIFSD